MKPTLNIYSNGRIIVTDDENIPIDYYCGTWKDIHKFLRSINSERVPEKYRFKIYTSRICIYNENRDTVSCYVIPNSHVREMAKFISRKPLTISDVIKD